MVLSSLTGLFRSIFNWTIRLLRNHLSTIKRKSIVACVIILPVFYGFWLHHYWGQTIILPFEVGHRWKSEDGKGFEIEFTSAMASWSKSRYEPLLIREHINIPIVLLAMIEEKKGDISCSDLFKILFYAMQYMQYDDNLVIDFQNQYDPQETAQRPPPDTGGLPIETIPESLGTPLGEIPLDFLNKLLLGKISLNTKIYRGSLSTIGECLTINIDRIKPNRKSWTVSGLTTARAELFNIITLSIYLERHNLSIKDLAFSLGFEEMIQNHFQKAANYFDIVSRIAPNDRDAAGLLGIVLYELHKAHKRPSTFSPGSEKKIVGNAINNDTYFNRAVKALKSAARPDLDSQPQPWIDYLSCIDPENVELDLYEHTIGSNHPINVFLLLKLCPLRGAEHHLSLTDQGQGVEAFVKGSINSFDGYKFKDRIPLAVKPRQILSHPKFYYPLILSEDGSLFTRLTEKREGTTNFRYLYQNRSLPIKQMVRGGKNEAIFLVDILGQIIKLQLNNLTKEKLYFDELPPVRQLIAQDEVLSILAEDGSIWRAPLAEKQAIQLTPPASVKEIAIKKSSVDSRLPLAIFALMENGNIWSYQEQTNLRIPKLSIIDSGINTRQIVATKSYLYALKYSGQVWRWDMHDPNPRWVRFRLLDTKKKPLFTEILAKETSFEVTDIYLLSDSELCVIKHKHDAKIKKGKQSVKMHCSSN